VQLRYFPSPEFGTKFQREVASFLEIPAPDLPSNTVEHQSRVDCVIPLARAILRALELCFIIKHYTNLRLFITMPKRHIKHLLSQTLSAVVGVTGGACLCALVDAATYARYWITFLVFSVLPAPDSPLLKYIHTPNKCPKQYGKSPHRRLAIIAAANGFVRF